MKVEGRERKKMKKVGAGGARGYVVAPEGRVEGGLSGYSLVGQLVGWLPHNLWVNTKMKASIVEQFSLAGAHSARVSYSTACGRPTIPISLKFVEESEIGECSLGRAGGCCDLKPEKRYNPKLLKRKGCTLSEMFIGEDALGVCLRL